MFITFEGLEKSGKTTQAYNLMKKFKDRNIVLTRDPGGAPSALPIRQMLLDKETRIEMKTELLLYMAARVELVEKVIYPALHSGKIVICDRFIDSTVAYQGYGNFYGDEDILEFIYQSHNLLTGHLWPDWTFFLDISLQESMRRFTGPRDRIELRDEEYFVRVQQGYYEIAQKNSHKVRTVHGERPESDISKTIWSILKGD